MELEDEEVVDIADCVVIGVDEDTTGTEEVVTMLEVEDVDLLLERAT